MGIQRFKVRTTGATVIVRMIRPVVTPAGIDLLEHIIVSRNPNMSLMFAIAGLASYPSKVAVRNRSLAPLPAGRKAWSEFRTMQRVHGEGHIAKENPRIEICV